MSEPDNRLEDELAEALAAEDAPAALEELRRRHAGDERTARQIRRTIGLVERLQQIGRSIDAQPVAPPAPLRLPSRRREAPRPIHRPGRPRLWPAAAAAAAALAAVWIFAPAPKGNAPRPNSNLLVASAPVESSWPAVGADQFSIPVSDEFVCPVMEMPSLSPPTVGGEDTTFSVPEFTWPTLSERNGDYDS